MRIHWRLRERTTKCMVALSLILCMAMSACMLLIDPLGFLPAHLVSVMCLMASVTQHLQFRKQHRRMAMVVHVSPALYRIAVQQSIRP